MPYVNIKLAGEPVSAEKKAEVIAGVTELLQRVLDKNPATTTVIIEEVSTDNWGSGGISISERRRRQGA